MTEKKLDCSVVYLFVTKVLIYSNARNEQRKRNIHVHQATFSDWQICNQHLYIIPDGLHGKDRGVDFHGSITGTV